MEACDGIVLATPECYEPEAIAALRDWLAETSRPIYAIGPLIPSGAQAAAFEKLQSSDAAKVESFLDAKLASHGEHSVLYVSLTFLRAGETSLTYMLPDILRNHLLSIRA